MKKVIFILTLTIVSFTIFYAQAYPGCRKNGYCYVLEGQNDQSKQNRLLAAVLFNPEDAPQVIFGSIFNFGLSLVGIAAMTMIVIGGIKYAAAAGNQSKIGEAKTMIWNAIWGLILAILAYLILLTINPELASPALRFPGTSAPPAATPPGSPPPTPPGPTPLPGVPSTPGL